MTDSRVQAQVITDDEEVLRRQIHPTRVDEVEIIHFTAFQPTGEEEYLLSTLRGKVSAEDCFNRHCATGLKSIGTYGVSIREAAQEQLDCLDDAGFDGAPEDHASIDFRPLARKERQRAARVLRDAALARRCLHPTDN